MDTKINLKSPGYRTIEDVLEDINRNDTCLESQIDKNGEKEAIRLLVMELSRQREYIKTITEELLLKKYV
jgi:hypothetical protein